MSSSILKEKIRECIVLHEQLRRVFSDEGVSIRNDSMEGISDRLNVAEHLKRRITESNTELGSLFEQYSRSTVLEGGMPDNEVKVLFRQLKAVIISTVGTVNETFRDVRSARDDVAGQLKNMSKSKVAMRAYARTG